MADFLTFIGSQGIVQLCLLSLLFIVALFVMLGGIYVFISLLLSKMRKEGVDEASIGIARVDFDKDDKDAG